MSNILITGGLGFIGSAIANRLKSIHNIIILDAWDESYPGYLKIHRGSRGLETISKLEYKHRLQAHIYRTSLIKNLKVIKSWSFNYNFDIIPKLDLVINCGSLSEAILSQYFKEFTNDSIVTGIQNIKKQLSCPVLHFSSSMAYGSWEGYKKEDGTKNPVDWYGECKYKSEQYLDLNKDIILRPMHVYGFGDGKFPITMNIERQAEKNQPVLVEEADCIYIKDLVDIIEIMISNWVPGIYNLSSGYLRNKEIIKKYSHTILHKNIETTTKSGPTGKDRGLLDSSKLFKTFNWKPSFNSYEETIINYFNKYNRITNENNS